MNYKIFYVFIEVSWQYGKEMYLRYNILLTR